MARLMKYTQISLWSFQDLKVGGISTIVHACEAHVQNITTPSIVVTEEVALLLKDVLLHHRLVTDRGSL